MKLIYFITPFILFHLTCDASSQLPWKVWKQEDDLKVSYRDATIEYYPKAKGLIEIKANLTVDSSLSGFLLFIQDVANTPQWLDGAKESQIIVKKSKQEDSFFVEVSTIWPLKPRLLLLHSRFWQNEDLSVDISVKQERNLNNLSNLIGEELSEFLIVEVHYAHWALTPEPFTLFNLMPRLNIEYILVADGGGVAPKWLANKVALRSIWQTMNNLKQQLPNSTWQKINIQGIKELKPVQ